MVPFTCSCIRVSASSLKQHTQLAGSPKLCGFPFSLAVSLTNIPGGVNTIHTQFLPTQANERAHKSVIDAKRSFTPAPFTTGSVLQHSRASTPTSTLPSTLLTHALGPSPSAHPFSELLTLRKSTQLFIYFQRSTSIHAPQICTSLLSSAKFIHVHLHTAP